MSSYSSDGDHYPRYTPSPSPSVNFRFIYALVVLPIMLCCYCYRCARRKSGTVLVPPSPLPLPRQPPRLPSHVPTVDEAGRVPLIIIPLPDVPHRAPAPPQEIPPPSYSEVTGAATEWCDKPPRGPH